MSLPDHNDDIDIVLDNPIAGKGNKKPHLPPPKPDFKPLYTSNTKLGLNLLRSLNYNLLSTLFTYILLRE